MGRVRIEVTSDDIDLGQTGSVTFCPIARALRRTYPDAHVHGWGWCQSATAHQPRGIPVKSGLSPADFSIPVIIEPALMAGQFRLSARAHRFVRDFDRGEHVVPSTFIVEAPIARLG